MTRARGQRGMVTAELATVAPFAVVLLVLLVWVVSLGLTQVRITDAAREGARLVARGETEQVATAAARRHAPDDASVRVAHDGDTVVVTVTSEAALPLPFFSHVGARTLTAESSAVMESS